ncbi:MAG: PLP-dependent aminotransferase family protein [Coriobacteriia bacterium]|nr:PLP-dependent aminotransferase family protein [Coriobacteriia bacterium]
MSNSAHISQDISSHLLAKRVTKMRSSAVRDLFSAASSSDVISLSGGMPDVSLLDSTSINKATKPTYKESMSEALQYGSTNGREETRAVFCDIMKEIGIFAKPDDVLLTTGAQEALDLIAKTFINPGDIIITEGPTYLGALQAFSAFEPDIHCIEFDENGMKTDLLEQKLKSLEKPAKLLYTIPNFQNPGGVTLCPERRKHLIELSKKYGFLIIEDDPYGRLRYDGGHIKPLKALDKNVIYLGTASKIFAPGLRLGWICASKSVLDSVNLVKQGEDLCGSNFTQIVVEHYFTDTPWATTLQKFKLTYKKRRDAMLKALDEYFPPEAQWTHPEGGFFIWVTLPKYVDCTSMLNEALEMGVTYTPGDGFYPDGKRGKNCMRIAFCYAEPADIEEAVKRLAKVIEQKLELYRAFIDAGAIKEE